ncbi:hypothetical protein WS86_28435 [Burkholderia savannae]|nr:hypothetical protein WS86_28435 [Burkholderia savannae]
MRAGGPFHVAALRARIFRQGLRRNVGLAIGRAGAVPLASLAAVPWALSPESEGLGLHGRIVDARAQAGCTPQVSQRAIRRDTTVSLVGAGLGVSPVPASPREDRRKMVVYRDIDAPDTPGFVRTGIGAASRRSFPVTRSIPGIGVRGIRSTDFECDRG